MNVAVYLRSNNASLYLRSNQSCIDAAHIRLPGDAYYECRGTNSTIQILMHKELEYAEATDILDALFDEDHEFYAEIWQPRQPIVRVVAVDNVIAYVNAKVDQTYLKKQARKLYIKWGL